MYKILKLKKGKDVTVKYHHPWLFSGAFEHIPQDLENGELVHIQNSENKIIATGTYSKKSMIAVRIFDFKEIQIDSDWIFEKIQKAHETRQFLGYGDQGKETKTTGYRLIFSESDSFPGLIVDRYENIFCLQISTVGMEKLKTLVSENLIKIFKPETIIERSDISVREEEGMSDNVSVLYGAENYETIFLENGLKFHANLLEGQKTGFYLDQKNLRQIVMKFAAKKKILNLFSYSGATGIYAIKGGASSVHNVDSSDKSLLLCEKNAKLNKIPAKKFTTENADIFKWLATKTDTGQDKNDLYDMIILDPPALIKSRRDIENGRKAYHFLNRAALRLLKEGGILVTSSCSHFLPEEDFSRILEKASIQTEKKLFLIEKSYQSPDHPISIYFPQSAYLKSFIFKVEK